MDDRHLIAMPCSADDGNATVASKLLRVHTVTDSSASMKLNVSCH